MNFPNAFKGLSKVLAAQILQIISVVVTIVGTLLLLRSLFGLDMVAAGISTIAMLAAVIVAIIAFIINLVGLAQARKDDGGFTNALALTLIALALSIVSSFLMTSNPGIANWLGVGSNIFELGAIEFVIVGVMNIAEKLGNSSMISFGQKMRVIITILWIIVIVAYIVGNSGLGTWLNLISTVLEFVVYIVYIVFLAKAKKMLA